MLRSLRDPTHHSWILGMDAFPTIDSYSRTVGDHLRAAMVELGPRLINERVELADQMFADAIPADQQDFLQNLQPYYRVGDTFFAHAALDPAGVAVEEQQTQTLIWGTEEFLRHDEGSEFVVYGQWNDGLLDQTGWPRPRLCRSSIGIDTITSGVLSAVIMPECRVIQSARNAA